MKKTLGVLAAAILCLAAAGWTGLSDPQDTPNLALNKNVRVSSTFDQSSWSPDFVVDGIRTERSGARGWSSQGDTANNHTEWIQIDLGTNYPINRVDLYPRNAGMREGESFPIDFTIQASLDAGNWKTVVARNGYPKPGTDPQKFTFDNTVARYVKITGTNLRYLGAESAYYMQFAEIEIYGPKTGEEIKKEEKPPVALVPSNWSGEIKLDNGTTQTLVITIGNDNQIAGQSIHLRAGQAAVRHVISGSYDPQTGAVSMRYSTKSALSTTEGTLTGMIESQTAAAGTITVKVTVSQLSRTVSTTQGTWRMNRQ